ncbi:MAG: hypothetical protein KGM16_08425 [Bacteroidota bacterium]|nr:hypothetical protein [Bacteroidota bacterium]
MEKIIQQEIFLFTGTRFSSRQCWQKLDENDRIGSEADQLQDACWNGLLQNMLPEIVEGNKDLYLWQIRENKSGIEIELGELPSEPDPYYSIDPYLFTEGQFMS